MTTATALDLRTPPADPGEPPHGRPRVGVSTEEARLLAGLAAGWEVLEIGTGLGVSTRALARTAARVVTVDPDPWVHEVIVPGLHDPSVECRRDWPPAGLDFDVIFVDGDHTARAVEADVVSALGRVRPNGLIVLHDWQLAEVRAGTRRATDLPVYEIATTYGLGLLIAPEESHAR